MSKKVPLKTNENGIVGKPAEPTVAPGGSVAAAACVAGARRRRAAALDADEPTRTADRAGGGAARPPAAAWRAAARGRAGPGRRRRDLQRAEVDARQCAADWSW